MANGSTEEWLVKLQDSLTDLKIASSNVEQKLDVIQAGFEKIDATIQTLTSATAKQETRIVVLEQRVDEMQTSYPRNLSEDFAVIKSQISGYQKIIWVVSTSMVGLIIKALYDALMV